MRVNNVKRRLLRDEVIVGVFLMSTDPHIVGVTAAAGYDYVMTDLEHSSLTLRELEQVVRAADAAGIVSLTRVASCEKPDILAALETGVKGIMAPVIESREQAEALVAAARYTPLGSRGAFYLGYNSEYGAVSPADHYRTANEELLVICQIETARGLQNAGEIASTPGVDAVLIGPGDLTGSLGIPFEFEHEATWDAIRTIFHHTRIHGKIAGIMPVDVDYARRTVEEGARLLLWGPDMILYQKGALADARELAAVLPWKPTPPAR